MESTDLGVLHMGTSIPQATRKYRMQMACARLWFSFKPSPNGKYSLQLKLYSVSKINDNVNWLQDYGSQEISCI